MAVKGLRNVNIINCIFVVHPLYILGIYRSNLQ